MAEPIINMCKCLFTTFLPMAFAASSLSRMALIILPHGDLSAFSENTSNVINTIEKIRLKHNFTKMLDEVITNSFNSITFSSKSVISDSLPLNKYAIKLINHSEFCRSTSNGAGLFSPVTFLTPLVSHSSCFTKDTTIPDINSVEIAR